MQSQGGWSVCLVKYQSKIIPLAKKEPMQILNSQKFDRRTNNKKDQNTDYQSASPLYCDGYGQCQKSTFTATLNRGYTGLTVKVEYTCKPWWHTENGILWDTQPNEIPRYVSMHGSVQICKASVNNIKFGLLSINAKQHPHILVTDHRV